MHRKITFSSNYLFVKYITLQLIILKSAIKNESTMTGRYPLCRHATRANRLQFARMERQKEGGVRRGRWLWCKLKICQDNISMICRTASQLRPTSKGSGPSASYKIVKAQTGRSDDGDGGGGREPRTARRREGRCRENRE